MIKYKNSKAFTLIELIVVIAVVGILVLLAMPKFLGHVEKTQTIRIRHDIKAIEDIVAQNLIYGNEEFSTW